MNCFQKWIVIGSVGLFSLVGVARSPDHFKELDQYLFQKSEGMTTNAAVVWVNGEVVYERYQAPTSGDTKHLTWSVSKSVLNLVVGAMEAKGKIDINKSICAYIPAPAPKCEIKVKDALEMSSGLGWRETYEGSMNPATSSVLQMLYGKGRKAMAAWVLGHSRGSSPGEKVYYSSGDSMVVSEVVRAILGQDQTRFLQQDFFGPLQIDNWTWEQDAAGALVGSSYLYLPARSLGKFGEMILREGRTESGDVFVKREWLKDTFQPASGYQRVPPPEGEVVAGRHWWLNIRLNQQIPWPSVPQDAVAALGHWGQSMVIIPSEGIVAVRYANDRGSSFKMDRYLNLVLRGVKQ